LCAKSEPFAAAICMSALGRKWAFVTLYSPVNCERSEQFICV